MLALTSPIGLGIATGLVVGKPLGITLFAWIAVRLRLAELPFGVTWPQLFSTSCLAGIGFTMALFIASAAFGSPELLAAAKIAILGASLLAALIGFALVRLTTSTQEEVSELDPAPVSA